MINIKGFFLQILRTWILSADKSTQIFMSTNTCTHFVWPMDTSKERISALPRKYFLSELAKQTLGR